MFPINNGYYMLLNKQWGEIVRLGNFMFKYASVLGIANKYNTPVCFPNNYMFNYFKNEIIIDTGIEPDINIGERVHYYDPELFEQFTNDFKTKNVNIMLNCFLQSPKYWERCEEYVIEMLKFKEFELDKIKIKYEIPLSKKTIGISIRRGDFIGHGYYWQIPTEFYLYALEKHFPDWLEYNIILFSDDPNWIRTTFNGDNIFYSNGDFLDTNYFNNPMEQLLYGSLCDNFIISNSTFSWWLGYLATNCKKSGKVVHSGKNVTPLFDKQYQQSNVNDYYHKNWIKSDFFDIENSYDFKNLSTNVLLKG